MLCQRCKKATATVHVTDLVGERKEMHLCDACAQEEGITVKAPVPINVLLEDFIKHQAAVQEMVELVCPKCGLNFAQFRQQGLLGCPHDYDTFEKVLGPLIAQAHEGATEHVGKVPAKAGAGRQRQHELRRLRRELDAAVAREDYERAAELRDQLKEFTEP